MLSFELRGLLYAVTGPQHLALSSAVGGVLWAVTGHAITVPIAIAAGVLPDVDHALDYYNRYIRRDWRRIYLLLHGWEYFALASALYLFVFPEPWMLAVTLGYLMQIGADQAANQARWFSYSLLARAVLKFDSRKILPNERRDSYDALVRSVPVFKDRLRSWFAARSEPRHR